MKTKTDITIAIPAYNEGENIGHLLQDIEKQKVDVIHIEKILVYSDGSTDDTVKIANEFGKLPIEVIETSKRQGLAYAQNKIMSLCKTDVLVILQADIRIYDSLFISKLINPILYSQADLTSAKILEIRPRALLQHILKVSMDMKREIIKNIDNANNIYACFGPARAYSKKLYTKLRFDFDFAEDAFSYIFCVLNNFKFESVWNTAAYYSLPKNLHDHYMQSHRFDLGKRRLSEYFGSETVNKFFNIPTRLKIRMLIKHFVLSPIYTFLYVLILPLSKVVNISNQKQTYWEQVISTKQVDYKKPEVGGLKYKVRNLFYTLFYLFDLLTKRKAPALVLCYHSINDDWLYSVPKSDFYDQMVFLAKEYEFVSSGDILNYCKGISTYKKPIVSITFDDGYADITSIQDVINEHRIKPTLFMLADSENVNIHELQTEKNLLAEDQLINLQEQGWEIASHGRTHPDFAKLSTKKMETEIRVSKQKLSSLIGKEVRFFAYPKGVYTKDAYELVKSSGYEAAFSMDQNIIKPGNTNIYAIPRVGIDYSHGLENFKKTISPSSIMFRNFVMNFNLGL